MAGIGTPLLRLDGPAKVTGAARYGSDNVLSHAAYGVMVTSAIARGRIKSFDESEARGLPGVLDIFTWRNIGKIEPGKTLDGGGYMGSSIAPMASADIHYDGQIVALVVGETFEAARDGAHRLKIHYEAAHPSSGFDSPGAETVAGAKASKSHKDPEVGEADAAFAAAPLKLDRHYSTATEHHNPMELFACAAAWQNGKLTVWESSQNMWGFKNGLAHQLGIKPEEVRVLAPFAGGAFGSRGSLTQRTAILARASQKLDRPIKLMTTRQQGFTIATYRAETRHHIKLGANADGKLLALVHEAEEVTSRPDPYMVAGTASSTRLYACPNVASKVSIVHADRNTPGFMRSPPETPYLFALETAMDELAWQLKMDPVELRRVNDTQTEPIKGLPYTSRSLMACFDAAADRFGWSRRNPAPGSMQDGDWLVGMGTAATMYPSNIAACAARVTQYADGTARVEVATHEIGQGIYTVCALIAASRLGLDPQKVQVELGDSSYPSAPVSGGSNSTASVSHAVTKACDDILEKRGRGEEGTVESYVENVPEGASPKAHEMMQEGKSAFVRGESNKKNIRYAFGAQFVEVRIHRLTGEIRVPRAVGAFAAGHIVNPVTARSQLMGGMIWGLSAALLEETEMDAKAGRYTNTNLADYLVPVNADVGKIDVLMLPEEDTAVNPLGIKGIGELGNVGMNAAVGNAVFHATGVRVRQIPIRLEKLLNRPNS